MPQSRWADLATIERSARSAADRISAEGEPVQYVRSTFVASDEMCIHIFTAGSTETVLRASLAAGLDPIRIVEALELDKDGTSTNEGDRS